LPQDREDAHLSVSLPDKNLIPIYNLPMIADLIKSALGRLRIVAFLEGVSYLVLLGIAMPLKYLAGLPQAVKVVGMAHGVLFVLFVIMLIQIATEKGWSFKKSLLSFISSLVPFGTFYADARWFRN
jgi:integral membrane protein